MSDKHDEHRWRVPMAFEEQLAPINNFEIVLLKAYI